MSETTELEGRELDRRIAEEVMGCHVRKQRGRDRWDLVVPGGVDQVDFCEPDGPWSAVPAYSTDIAAAWTVVEKMISMGYDVHVYHLHRGKWAVSMDHHDEALATEACGDSYIGNHMRGEDVPRMIVEVALKAVRAAKAND